MNTRDRILSAAADLFSRDGYCAVTTMTIATSARVSEVTVFRHFQNKRALHSAVVNAEVSKLSIRPELLSRLDAARTRSALMTETLFAVGSVLEENRRLQGLLSFILLEGEEELQPELRCRLDEVATTIALRIETAQTRGVILRSAPKDLVLAFLSIAINAAHLSRIFCPGQSQTDGKHCEFVFQRRD